MEQVCHRCGAALSESDPFCPQCGAPQLRYEAPDEPVSSPNVLPAQRFTPRNPNAISWHDAILTAALVAVPAGVLSSLLGLEALWVIAGGVAVISFYRRRTGTLPNGRMGWRIGLLFGLFAAAIATAVDGISLLVERYALHHGSMLSQRYYDLGQQLTDQLTRSNPDAASALPGFVHFWVTPDGAAAMVLINAAGLAISMLLFAAAGGALGARLTAKAPQHSAR
ncbi:MAG: zinc ribbon domain-containing protein [Silvibacterium sp.]